MNTCEIIWIEFLVRFDESNHDELTRNMPLGQNFYFLLLAILRFVGHMRKRERVSENKRGK
jgi:hypothetical protein